MSGLIFDSRNQPGLEAAQLGLDAAQPGLEVASPTTRQNLGYKPYEQYKQDEPFINELRAPITSPRARICGLTTRTFWIVFVIVLVVLGAAVGGGVGGGLAASHSTMTSPQGQSSSTASSPTSASSTSSSPYSTASSTATSSSIAPFSTAPGTYRIINIATNTAVDLLFGGTTNGTRIDGWSWNPASSPTQYIHQSWQMASVDNGAVIMYNTQTKSYITAPSNLTAGTNPPNTDDAGLYGGVPGDPSDAHTQWVIVPNSDNSISFSSKVYSTKLIDIAASNVADGTSIVLWETNGGLNQRWKLVAS